MAFIKASNLELHIPTFGEGGKSIRATIANSFGLTPRIGSGVVKIFDNLNFTISNGDRVALLGPNGAGKTSLLRLMAGIYWPTRGNIEVVGKVKTLISLGSGLDPNLSGLENIKRLCLISMPDVGSLEQIVDEVAQFSGLNDYLEMPVRTYSEGMRLRLISGTVFTSESEIFLVDEFFGTGDEEFTRKVRLKMEEQVNRANIFVLATHSKDLAKGYCNRAFFVDGGAVTETPLI